MKTRDTDSLVDLYIRLLKKDRAVPVDLVSELHNRGIDTCYLNTLGGSD